MCSFIISVQLGGKNGHASSVPALIAIWAHPKTSNDSGCIHFNLIILLQQICHRDLKLENTLLDGSSAPRLKICDFGYSKVITIISAGVDVSITLQLLSFLLAIAVICIAFATKVNCRNTGLYCSRGFIKKGIRWQGEF